MARLFAIHIWGPLAVNKPVRAPSTAEKQAIADGRALLLEEVWRGAFYGDVLKRAGAFGYAFTLCSSLYGFHLTSRKGSRLSVVSSHVARRVMCEYACFTPNSVSFDFF